MNHASPDMTADQRLFAENATVNQAANSEEYLAGKTQLTSFPYHIQIGADNRCNLRCGFCLADAYRKHGKVHLQDQKLDRNPIAIFEALVPYMKYWKVLSLTGPGESLINPRLDEILLLVRRNSSCDIVVTTNGVLINQRLTKIFLDCGVTEVSISLDSIDATTFRDLRVNGELDKVQRGIDLINEEKRRRGTDLPRLNLTPTFFKQNIRELPDFVDYAARNGVHQLQASPGQVYREDWVEKSLLGAPELTRRMAAKATKRAQELGVTLINNLRMVYVNRGNPLLKALRSEEPDDFPTDPSTCLKPWASLYVEPDGEVRPCCYQSPILGNLYQSSFEEIWNGSRAVGLRQSMLDRNPPEECRNCYEFNRHRPEIMVSLDAVPE